MSEAISIVPKKENKMDFRLVSNNILLQSLVRRESKRLRRAAQLYDAYADMDADLFTLQEVDELWHDDYKLDLLMKELGYAQVPMVARGDFVYLGTSDIRNPIFYKADRFDLLECGYDRYAATVFPAPEKGKAPEYPSSSYTWAVLRREGRKRG